MFLCETQGHINVKPALALIYLVPIMSVWPLAGALKYYGVHFLVFE